MVSHSVKIGVNILQNREEKHFLGFVEFIERALCNADRLRQLIHGGFLHPQRDSAMSRFLQQRLAELLGLVIGKSQASASLKYDRFSLFGHIIPRFFRFCKRCGEKLANQKECSVAERDTGIPVTGNRCRRGKRNYIIKGHQSEAFKRCVLIPILFHIAQMG
jgi:hypothetical protein